MTNVLGMAAFAIGVGFFLAGSIGILRFPDLFSRLHALTKADNLGLGLIAVGVMLHAPSLLFAVKALLVWVVAVFASAVTSHLIARQAFAAIRDGDGHAGD